MGYRVCVKRPLRPIPARAKSTGLAVIKMNEQEDIGFALMFSFYMEINSYG